MVQLEPVVSSLVSHRGYDPEKRVMYVRFTHKQFKNGPLYSYGNISPVFYAEGCSFTKADGEVSFGSWITRLVKPNFKDFPYRLIEEANNGSAEPTTLDFTSQQPVEVNQAEELPEDKDELVAKALQLQEQVKAIVINSPEAYQLASRTGVAIASMQKALEKAFYEGPDGITERHTNWKNAIAVFNNYNNPLESDKNRLKEGMKNYRREQDAIAQRAADAERRRLQNIADEDARKRAEELKKLDVQRAIDDGDKKLAKQIEKAAPLPVTPAYVPPQPVQTATPAAKGVAHVEKWVHEYVDERGEPVSEPRIDLIPRQYWMVDEKAIAAAVRSTKGRTNISGVRAYDEGGVRLTSKR